MHNFDSWTSLRPMSTAQSKLISFLILYDVRQNVTNEQYLPRKLLTFIIFEIVHIAVVVATNILHTLMRIINVQWIHCSSCRRASEILHK